MVDRWSVVMAKICVNVDQAMVWAASTPASCKAGHSPATGRTSISMPCGNAGLPGDGDGVFERVDLEEEVTTDGLLGLGEGTVRHNTTVFTGDEFASGLEGVPRDGLAFGGQPGKPVHPMLGDLLGFLGRKAFVPVGAAEDQHEFVRGCFAHSFVNLRRQVILSVQ